MWHGHRSFGASFPGGPVLPEVGVGACPLHIFDIDVGGNVYFWKKRRVLRQLCHCVGKCAVPISHGSWASRVQ